MKALRLVARITVMWLMQRHFAWKSARLLAENRRLRRELRAFTS